MKERIPISREAIGRLWYSDSPSLDYFHRHDELECNIVRRGRASYLLENQRIDMEANSIVWLFPEQEHLMLDVSHDFALWILVMRPSYLAQSCISPVSQTLLEKRPSGLFVRHINKSAADQLEYLCQQAVASVAEVDLHNATLGHLLHACWSAFRQGSLVPLKQQLHPAIHKIARQLLDGNQPDDVQTLAKQVGLTPETISRLFKKQTGLSLTTYRNRCKLDRFLALYGEGHTVTMLEAALTAGFGSYAQFYRVFSQLMGQSPANYRRQLKSSH